MKWNPKNRQRQSSNGAQHTRGAPGEAGSRAGERSRHVRPAPRGFTNRAGAAAPGAVHARSLVAVPSLRY